MITFTRTTRVQRVLDFDLECRPLGWYGGGDLVHKEITAIAAQFIGEKKTYVWLLGRDKPRDMLEGMVALYDEADIVTGHYIRGFDLPTLNGALLEYQMAPLGDKLTQDTKLDLIKRSGLSMSMENLGALLGLDHPKIQMDQAKWREANRLTAKGLRYTEQRVVGDVKQHIELRERLLRLNLLRSPVLWSSDGSGVDRGYTP